MAPVRRISSRENRSGICCDVQLTRIGALAHGQQLYLQQHPKRRYVKIWVRENEMSNAEAWSGVQVICGNAKDSGAYFIGRNYALKVGDSFDLGPHVCDWQRETLPIKGQILKQVPFEEVQRCAGKRRTLARMNYCYRVVVD